jgi:hypothetical protein
MRVASITVDKTLSEINFEDAVVATDEICSCDTLRTTEAHLLITDVNFFLIFRTSFP